jgi:hypothetical protein
MISFFKILAMLGFLASIVAVFALVSPSKEDQVVFETIQTVNTSDAEFNNLIQNYEVDEFEITEINDYCEDTRF